MATENILMAAVTAGGDRQDLHERIRLHSLAAADRVKQQGEANDLMSRLAADEAFASVDLDAMILLTSLTPRCSIASFTDARDDESMARDAEVLILGNLISNGE